jgi:gamma-glutamylcyclotransferase (GGCT)/AIG2-like uncharacterized protein YtfP
MSDPNPITHFAVYGTLRPGHANNHIAGLAEKTVSKGSHRIKGDMYAVPNTGYGGANYPGAIVTESSIHSTIEVELLEAKTSDEELEEMIRILDEFENEPGLPPEYRRIEIMVNEVPAWFYEYIGDVSELPKVANGVWEIDIENNAEHKISFDASFTYWSCSLCGARGLDGEDSPRDIACVVVS